MKADVATPVSVVLVCCGGDDDDVPVPYNYDRFHIALETWPITTKRSEAVGSVAVGAGEQHHIGVCSTAHRASSIMR